METKVMKKVSMYLSEQKKGVSIVIADMLKELTGSPFIGLSKDGEDIYDYLQDQAAKGRIRIFRNYVVRSYNQGMLECFEITK